MNLLTLSYQCNFILRHCVITHCTCSTLSCVNLFIYFNFVPPFPLFCSVRMRDVSNVALRNAVQSEQLNASSTISRLKHSYEEDKRTFSDFMTNKIRIVEEQNVNLQQEIITANEEIIRIKKEHDNDNVRTVAKGLRDITAAKDEWEKEKSAQYAWLVQENKRY